MNGFLCLCIRPEDFCSYHITNYNLSYCKLKSQEPRGSGIKSKCNLYFQAIKLEWPFPFVRQCLKCCTFDTKLGFVRSFCAKHNYVFFKRMSNIFLHKHTLS